jgi:hypothetical protein
MLSCMVGGAGRGCARGPHPLLLRGWGCHSGNMPSVATQTGWSWLHDLKELEDLARRYGGNHEAFGNLQSPTAATGFATGKG